MKASKKIQFFPSELSVSTLGAALAGLNLKINLADLCKQINNDIICQNFPKLKLTVKIYVVNKGYTFEVKTPLTSELLNSFANENKEITKEDIEKIAKIKFQDMNTNNIQIAIKTIEINAKKLNYKVK